MLRKIKSKTAPKPPKHDRASRLSRAGSVTVEFALVSSIAFLLILGSIEFSRIFMIRGGAGNAAYQGARRAIVPGATAALAEQAARDTLTRSFVKEASISVSPSVITSSTNEVNVTVRVELSKNSWIASRFTPNMVITRSCTLSRQVVD